ncbi:hypothetical protein PLESTB_000580700 [Pleodorina starrii]|uniref:Uncharacterized protein n=1 Tax=Pleodorina starrii TaxID=330485 RepID=A0A9W6F1E5_9CHLO|nr:hypothetical protein PLESTM_000303700 [Pleodorina starrii]GLC52081.1 hypothetical protein PLESTB_000580700 [Pleodorina starrii]GLC72224.1 hypothetical protein PLESTF_001220900 [Pleodorina starrii]
MQPFRSHVMGKASHQAPCTSGLSSTSIHHRGSRMLPRVSALSESANGNGKVHSKQLKFFYFDPNNPEEVREMHAKHRDMHSHHHSSNNGTGSGYNGNGNGVHHSNGHAQSNGHTSSQQLVHVKDTSKDLAQLQRLNAQLEEARSAVAKLQQYEVLYKESRMRSKQMQVEVSTLQQLLADKDAELARQYKRMELEASERSGLRTQFTSAVDEVRALRNELEEARQAMLELRGIIPANVTLRRGLPPRTSSGLLDEAGSGSGFAAGSSSSSPDVLSSLQGLAKQLAEGMEQEVGSLFGGAAGKRDA